MKKTLLWMVLLLLIVAFALAAPQLTINNPSSSIFNTSNITFNITLNETGSAWYNLNNGTNISMDSSDNLTFTAFNDTLTDGGYVAYFFGNDTANVTNNTEFVSFIIDLTAPNYTIVSPAVNENFTVQSVLFNLTVYENLTSVVATINNTDTFLLSTADNVSWTYTNSSVPNGDYNVSFVLTDVVGNVNETVNRTFSVNYTAPDVDAPGVTINEPSVTLYNTSSITFNITANETVDAAFINVSDVLYQMDTADNLIFNYTNSSMVDGNYTVYFIVNDSSNNVNDTQFVNFVVDTTAPNYTVVSPTLAQNFTSGTSVTFNVTVFENVTSIVGTLNGSDSFVLTNVDNVSWTYTNATMSNGDYNVSFVLTDVAGNVNETVNTSFSVNYTAPDLTAPVVTVVSPAAGLYNASVNLTLSLDEPGVAWFNLNNGSNTSMAVTNSTYFTFNYTNLVSGNYVIYFFANDTSNNTNSSVTVDIVVDATAPNYTLVTPTTNENFTSSPQVVFNLTVYENLTSVVGSLNGVDGFVLSSSDNVSWTYTNSSVPNGDYNVSYVLTDVVGNVNETVNRTFSVNYTAPDVDAPFINITNPENNSLVNTSVINFTVIINESGVVYFNVSDAPATFITMNTSDNLSFYFYNASIADGGYDVTFFANDTSNNTANATISFVVDTDVTSPALTINSPSSSLINTSSVTFNITANETLDTAFINVSGTLYTMVSTDNLTFNYTNASMTDGNYTVYFIVNDSSNNINNTESVSFTVDTSLPSLTLSFPTNNSYVNLSENFSFTVSDLTTTTITVSVNGNSSSLSNNWFTPFSSISTSAQYNISLIAIDALNNTNITHTYVYYVDVDTPDINVTIVNTTTPTNFTFSVYEGFSNLSAVWYEFNGVENFTINSSVDVNSLSGEVYDQIFPGLHTLNFFANDSVGNTVNQSAVVQVVGELNLSQQQDAIISSVNNASAAFVLPNGTRVNTSSPIANNTDLDNLSFEIMVNQTIPLTINFTGVNGSRVLWNRSLNNITDNTSIFAGSLLENFTLSNFSVLSVLGQKGVFPSGSYSYISVLFDINPSSINTLYYFSDEIIFEDKTDINLCNGGSFSVNDTLPCWENVSNQTKIYLESFSTVIVGNDTVAPSITVDTPTSAPTTSYFVPTINVSSDVDTCTMYYNNTDVNYTGVFDGTQCTFATLYATDGFNGSLNFTVNDTAGNVNSTIFEFNFSDSSDPVVTITAPANGSTVTTSSVTLSVSANERVTLTRSYNGGSYSSCFTNATSGSCTVSSLSDGSRSITVNATDLSGNSVLETVSFTVDIPSSGGSSGDDDDDDDDNDNDSPRRTSSNFANYPTNNEVEEEEPAFTQNNTPKEYKTAASSEEEFDLTVNDSITVTTQDREVMFTFVSFDDERKTAVLRVGDQEVTVSMAEVTEFDSDGDGENDLSITLKNLAAGIAQLVFSDTLREEQGDNTIQEDVQDDAQRSIPWVPVGILAVFALIILGVILYLKHRARSV